MSWYIAQNFQGKASHGKYLEKKYSQGPYQKARHSSLDVFNSTTLDIHTYIHIYIHTHIHTYIHTYVHACVI